MRKSTLLFIIIIIFVGVNTSYGFQTDGLKDGMTKEKVVEILSRMNFDKIVDEGSSVKFCDLQGKKSDRFWVVSFKKNKLTSFHKNYEPSMSNYITLFRLLYEQYGMDLHCSSTSDMMSNGEKKTLLCTWTHNKEYITIGYDISPSQESLYVWYLVK